MVICVASAISNTCLIILQPNFGSIMRSPGTVPKMIRILCSISSSSETIFTDLEWASKDGGKDHPFPKNDFPDCSILSSYHYCRAADYHGSPVGCCVPHPRSRFSTNHHGGGSLNNSIRRAYTNQCIPQQGCGKFPDQNCWCPRAYHRPPHMRDGRQSRSLHGTGMHIC